jgi:hypothetical protein
VDDVNPPVMKYSHLRWGEREIRVSANFFFSLFDTFQRSFAEAEAHPERNGITLAVKAVNTGVKGAGTDQLRMVKIDSVAVGPELTGLLGGIGADAASSSAAAWTVA